MHKQPKITDEQTWLKVLYNDKGEGVTKTEYVRKIAKFEQFEDGAFQLAVKGIIAKKSPDFEVLETEIIEGFGCCVVVEKNDGMMVQTELEDDGFEVFDTYEECIDYLYENYPDLKEEIRVLE